MCAACSTRYAWPRALMRSADRVPINLSGFVARPLKRDVPILGHEPNSSSASVHPSRLVAYCFHSRCCSNRRTPERLLSRHHRPGDPGKFVGQRQGNEPERAAAQQLPNPARKSVQLVGNSAHDGRCTDGQQSAQIPVALLGDPTEFLFAAAGVLPRDQSDPGGEFTAGLKYPRISDRGYDGRGRDRSDTRDCRQATADNIRLVFLHH